MVYRLMRILLSPATHSDRNFSVGLGLVVILAAAEIFSASFYYISRIRAGGTSVQSVAASVVRRSATPVTPTAVPVQSQASLTLRPPPPDSWGGSARTLVIYNTGGASLTCTQRSS